MSEPVPSIKCPVCGWRSHHPRDIAELFCGHCRGFHADLIRWRVAAAILRSHGWTDEALELGADGLPPVLVPRRYVLEALDAADAAIAALAEIKRRSLS